MIIIEKAILHILDFHSGVTVYSDTELPVKDSIETWLLKHIERPGAARMPSRARSTTTALS